MAFPHGATHAATGGASVARTALALGAALAVGATLAVGALAAVGWLAEDEACVAAGVAGWFKRPMTMRATRTAPTKSNSF